MKITNCFGDVRVMPMVLSKLWSSLFTMALVATSLATGYSASAQTVAFTDNFNNGNVRNSDDITGFWELATGGGKASVSESDGRLRLSTGSSPVAANDYATLYSVSTHSFLNFYNQRVELNFNDLLVAGSSGAWDKQYFGFALQSSAGLWSSAAESIVFTVQKNRYFSLIASDGTTIFAGRVNPMDSSGQFLTGTNIKLVLDASSGTSVDFVVTFSRGDIVYDYSKTIAFSDFANPNFMQEWQAKGNSAVSLFSQTDADDITSTWGVGQMTVLIPNIPEPSQFGGIACLAVLLAVVLRKLGVFSRVKSLRSA